MGHRVEIPGVFNTESLGGCGWALGDPGCPRAALTFIFFLTVSSGWLPAPCWPCHASLGLLLLLRAEVSTVARLSFVSYISHYSPPPPPSRQIISTQLILNFSLFAPAVGLLAQAKNDCSMFTL